jgi:hypothetical protein
VVLSDAERERLAAIVADRNRPRKIDSPAAIRTLLDAAWQSAYLVKNIL